MSALRADGAGPKGPGAPSFAGFLKRLFIGRKLDPDDRSVFHHISLVAFFAWVGLGADGLSSSCYGPAEAFVALGEHGVLAVFVALATALTIFVISSSYSQIIARFPAGGGGYVVASKLLSPRVGMVSGCALLIDYVLTITISIASGADALFSFLPPQWQHYRLMAALCGVGLLTLLNLRGVKESIQVLMPIFLVFVLTHAFAIFYGLAVHGSDMPALAGRIVEDIQSSHAQMGLWGMLALFLHAYSMGAGTYTGIEAVSNGLAILREPKVQTGRRTMTYMAVSLAVTVFGLMIGYILYDVRLVPGKTLNAVLFEAVTAGWGGMGPTFVLVTLVSEAAILFVAAQAGFLDGPRVLANMAQDRWFPTKFAMLSDRLVTQNGILLMGGSALVLMAITDGAVAFLIVLYSINVFITFALSQLGMVRHWLAVRASEPGWRHGLIVNGIGLVLTAFILVTVTVVKFGEGGWVTLVITGLLVGLALLIRKHYDDTWRLLKKLDALIPTALVETGTPLPQLECDPSARTAVILVNGFNGLGLHTLFTIRRLFASEFKNFVFVQVGVVDAGVFKGAEQMDIMHRHMASELDKYVSFMRRNGIHAEARASVGTDVVEEIAALSPDILARFPRAVFFGGQIVFPEESFWTRLLHNYVVFAVQRRLYRQGIPFVIMPVRI